MTHKLSVSTLAIALTATAGASFGTNAAAQDDLIWRHDNGRVHYWDMVAGARQGGHDIVFSPVGAEWTLEGAGDLDADGDADLVWRHTNGQVHYWEIEDGERIGAGNIHAPVGAAWSLIDAGDLNGDGTDDLVWRHTNGQTHYWRIENFQRMAGGNIFTPVGADWTLAGAGDLNGDGTDDLVWRHNNGQTHYWRIENFQRVAGGDIFTPVGADWTLAGAGDLNGDGTDDLVWRHNNGQAHYWPITNFVRQGGVNLHTPVGAAWTLAAVGDVAEGAPGGSATPANLGFAEDCISHNPNTVEAAERSGSWKVVDGSHWMLDAGAGGQAEMERAVEIIQHYGLTQQCFIGRPDASLTYWLTASGAPSGSLGGEDCISLNPDGLTVEQLGSIYRIINNGSNVPFSAPNQQEANRIVEVVRHYGFTRTCYVGRPGASMIYLLR